MIKAIFEKLFEPTSDEERKQRLISSLVDAAKDYKRLSDGRFAHPERHDLLILWGEMLSEDYIDSKLYKRTYGNVVDLKSECASANRVARYVLDNYDN